MSTENAREVIERTWNAPIELVWELWTTPEGFESWHGPNGFRADVITLDPQPGGALDYTMTATDPEKVAWMKSKGRPLSWPAKAKFTEVVPHERLVFEMVMPMGPGIEATMTHTVTFEQTDAGVHMVFILEAAKAEMIGGAAMGYRSSFDRFDAALAARR